jgi:class 3 adenylate cyclase
VVQEPDTEYAVAADGAHLAFQVVGDGPRDLVLTPNSIPMDSLWEDVDLTEAIDRLAASARLVLFDPRGLGASDALAPGRVPTAEELMADTAAVMDAAGSSRAFVFTTDSAASAVLLATTWPDRVSGLVFLNAYARLARGPDYPIGLPAELVSQYIHGAETYRVEIAVQLLGHARADDARFRRWFLKALRRSAPPGSLATLVRQDFATDVRHVLPLVQVPTLVLHSSGDPYVPAAHGRYLADHIPGARYREVPGTGHNLAAADVATIVDHVAEFVTGSPAPRRIDRVLATVLFSDIVDSTRLAARLGDARWRSLLDQHDGLVARQLARFGGRLVKTTGDGVLATLDGPARAVACALAIRDGLRRLDLDVRIGIHTGEIEARGADISGIAVNIAARVQGLAARGQILTTRTVVDLVAGSDLGFDDPREVELKGVPGTWTVFAVTGG